MTPTNAPVFVLDANVLIDLGIWLPIPLHSVFWAKFQQSLAKGEWALLDVVADEIRYDKDLKQWCADQKQAGLMRSISDDHRNRAVEINNRYKMIDDTTGNSTTDTYVVAYAEANNMTVFTRETHRENSTKLYKIPDVCDALKVSWIRVPREFFEAIGFKN